jgi:hypothetical protein
LFFTCRTISEGQWDCLATSGKPRTCWTSCCEGISEGASCQHNLIRSVLVLDEPWQHGRYIALRVWREEGGDPLEAEVVAGKYRVMQSNMIIFVIFYFILKTDIFTINHSIFYILNSRSCVSPYSNSKSKSNLGHRILKKEVPPNTYTHF